MSEFNTPWEVTRARGTGTDKIIVIDANDSEVLGCADDEENLAAHIVLCVNAHQGLVDALHTTCERLKDMGQCMGDETPVWNEVDSEISAATKALAAAGVKQ